MEINYHFDQFRAGTSNKNQLVAQGTAAQELLKDYEIKTFLGEKELSCDSIISRMSAVDYQKRNDPKLNKQLTIVVDLPDDIDSFKYKNTKLYIYAVSKEDNTQKSLLARLAASKCRSRMKEMNALFDSVLAEGDILTIKGWAIDRGDISFTASAGGRRLNPKIDRYTRDEILAAYPEYSGSNQLGYTIRLPLTNDKYLLRVEADGRVKTFNIYGSLYTGRHKFIARIEKYLGMVRKSLRRNGLKLTLAKIMKRLFHGKSRGVKNYSKWIAKQLPNEKELKLQRNTHFEYEPTFSILVPLYETEERYLRELVYSVFAQSYPKWELILSDGSPDHERLEGIVKKLWSGEKRIKYIADKKGPLGIAMNTNQALKNAKGDYIVLGDHDDLFTPDALYECVKAINANRETDVIYTDEDKVDMNSKYYFEPNFKPDFNIDLLRSNNYICHMFVAKSTLVEEVGEFDASFDGAQDYDFIFRCVEKAKRVHHIARILYRWRSHSGSTAENPEAKLYAFEAGKRAIEAHYIRCGLRAKVTNGDNLGFYRTEYVIKNKPLISIIIPNKDHIDDLKKCMDSIDHISDYKNYEYVIVENNSTEQATFDFYNQIAKRENVNVVYWKDEFNYSAINNFGVRNAKGEYILLLNNDTEIINPDCLRQLLGYCQREDVGIVGARLYYEDDTIQHAGVIIGYGGIAGHAFVTLNENDDLYQSRTKVACDYSAVTAACLMTKKSVFEEVGGLDETFKVAFNDVDFCLRVRQTGRLVVYNANAKLHHFESKSRGLEDTPEKVERFNDEISRFQDRWSEILEKGDPYYNVNLTLDRADFSPRL